MDRFPPVLLAALLGALPVGGLAVAASAGQPPPPDAGFREPPPVFLLTMGPDDSVLFRQWGHAALCIADRCLNYGVTDFSRPLGLVRDVLRDRAVFWVEVSPYDAVLATYSRQERSVFRQDLELSPAALDSLLGRLAPDLTPGENEYIYNHFDDNCTTRIRDYLDEAAGGALREPVRLPAAYDGRGGNATFRTHIRRGLGDRPLLLWLSDIGIGSQVDRPISSFEAMFLPGALRHGVEAAYGAAPRQLRRGRDGDLLPPDPGSAPYLPWLLGISGGLALLVLIGGDRTARLAGGAAAAAMTLLGVVGLGMVAASPLPEFRSSLVWLAIPASDFLLAGRQLRWYGPLRLLAGGVFLAALLLGWASQPLGWTIFAGLLPVAAIVWRSRRRTAPPA